MTNQVLHIFKNDVRHFWRELGLMIAIVVAYGWQTSIHSQESGFLMDVPFFASSSEILSLLVPVSFIFLMLRAIHAECPVGDRQFWVTRPYDWRQLLAAKLLFTVLFSSLPLFVLQAFLLWHGGFWPPKYIWGLLQFQLIWSVFIFLPVGTLAVVTASIGQFLLGALALLLYFIALGEVMGKIPNSGVGGTDLIPFWISDFLLATVVFAVIFRQYAHRRTAWSRIVLLSLGVAVPALFAVTPYRMLIARAYPVLAPDRPLPVQLAFDPARPASLKGGYPEKNKVHIKLPLLVSGMAEGSRVVESGILVVIDGPGGLHWESGWRGGHGELLADRPRNSEAVTLDKVFFERMKSASVNVHLIYALIPARARQVVHIVAGPGPFTVPDDGKCSFSPLTGNRAMCLFPPQKIDLMLLSAKMEEITCKPGENTKPRPVGRVAYGWAFQTGSSILNPVVANALNLSDFGDQDERNFPEGVCPGTALTVYSDWQEGPGYRDDLEIDGIRLADYEVQDSASTAGMFEVSLP